MSNDSSITMKRYEVENEQKWQEEIEHIPFIQFPSDWLVRIIPPFGDAVVRFQVELPSGKRKSVYLDCRSSLGCFDASATPYWEVYPVKDGIARCKRDDVDALLALIAEE